jgi:ABC-type transport system involved in Fe-S cluster assembly, permease component
MSEIKKQEIIRFSKSKKESKKILDSRLSALNEFLECSNPVFGPDLKLDYSNIDYFEEQSIVKNKLETEELIICDIHTALKEYKNIIDKYFKKLILDDENKFTMLNSVVWENGTFVYICPGSKVNIPIEKLGFTRNLIIVDEKAELNYIDVDDSNKEMQVGVTEVFVLENAICRYINIQRCSTNTYNFSIKRFQVEENGKLDFINISAGSKINMSYPSIILNGDNSKSTVTSIVLADKNQILDEGIKILHLGCNTKSIVQSNNIVAHGGEANYREIISIKKDSKESNSIINNITTLFDERSKGDVASKNIVENDSSEINNTNSYENMIGNKYNKNKCIRDFLKDLNISNDLIKCIKGLLK